MNENINIAEILKDAPLWTKLYSPTYGNCEFQQVNDKYNGTNIIIISEDHETITLDWNGHKKGIENGECIIFPSKDNRNWSTFKAPWKHKNFELGQKILVPYNDGTIYKWRLTFYSHYDESSKHHMTTDAMCFPDEEVIAYKGNENKLGKSIETK